MNDGGATTDSAGIEGGGRGSADGASATDTGAAEGGRSAAFLGPVDLARLAAYADQLDDDFTSADAGP